MITAAIFDDKYGKLGNQLFELGLLFAIRRRRGHDFYLPRNGAALWKCFDLDDIPADGPDCPFRFDEVNGSCNYDPGVFEQPDGTNYHGYFQSYRYLEGCRAELSRLLRFKLNYRAHSEAVLFAFRRRYRRPLVSMHIRRNDYVIPDAESHWGNLFRDGYYQRAVDAIGDGVTYLVFSDDVAWCRQNLDVEPVEFADFDTYTCLSLMTGADVNVIANSTFSWWGAYLNQAAEVYAPSRWFGPAMPPPNDRQDDIVPPHWRTIPVFWDDVDVRQHS